MFKVKAKVKASLKLKFTNLSNLHNKYAVT